MFNMLLVYEELKQKFHEEFIRRLPVRYAPLEIY